MLAASGGTVAAAEEVRPCFLRLLPVTPAWRHLLSWETVLQAAPETQPLYRVTCLCIIGSNSRMGPACQLNNLMLSHPWNYKPWFQAGLPPPPTTVVLPGPVKPTITASVPSAFSLLLPSFKASLSFPWMAASSVVFPTPVSFLRSCHATPASVLTLEKGHSVPLSFTKALSGSPLPQGRGEALSHGLHGSP